MQPVFVRSLSAGAERALRLIQRPPLITSVSASGNVITISSYVTGLDTPMASWNSQNIHFFVVATVALMLAVPLRSRMTRAKLILLAFSVGWVVSLGICVVQLETVAETYAQQYLRITLHTVREKALLEWANQALITVGMLLVPALLFLLTYLSLWLESPQTREERMDFGSRRPPAPSSTARISMASGIGLALAVMIAAFLLTNRPNPDPHTFLAGWAKLAALNPDFAPAHVNVGIGLEEGGRLDEAIEAYRRALRADPERALAHYNLGNALVKKGLYADAARAYEKVLDKEPDNAGAHKNLSIALLYLDRGCEALPHLERSAELDARTFADAHVASQIADLRARCGRK